MAEGVGRGVGDAHHNRCRCGQKQDFLAGIAAFGARKRRNLRV